MHMYNSSVLLQAPLDSEMHLDIRHLESRDPADSTAKSFAIYALTQTLRLVPAEGSVNFDLSEVEGRGTVVIGNDRLRA